MQGPTRKVLQAVLYEAIAVACITPMLALLYDEGLMYSGLLSVLMSAIALGWNVLFNALFERWEVRQPRRRRTLARRLLHALGFEGGLTVMLLPLIASWLGISWWAALATNLGLFGFFFFYSLAFQWVFDRLFDVPVSAMEEGLLP